MGLRGRGLGPPARASRVFYGKCMWGCGPHATMPMRGASLVPMCQRPGAGGRGEFLRCQCVLVVVVLLVPGARYVMTCVMTPMTDLTLP